MPEYTTTRRIRHSAGNMYDLVADIENYPEFVPLCESLKVKTREASGNGEIVHADMTVAYKLLRETFTSRVSMDPDRREIITEAVHGPFRQMRNCWKFREAGPDCCDVEFTISYEFRTFALQLLVGGLFDRVFRKFAGAFEDRANVIYGLPAGEK